MKKILIDVDDVICDPGFLVLINKFLNTDYKIEDFKDYYIESVILDDNNRQEFYKYYLENNPYDCAEIYAGACDIIKKLNDVYDVYICSSCVNPFFIEDSGKLFMYKYNWLLSTFPFLDPHKFIFTSTKNLFKADIQIDDKLSNLDNDIPLKLLFTSYHNKDINDEELKKNNVIRANNWKEIEKLLL